MSCFASSPVEQVLPAENWHNFFAGVKLRAEIRLCCLWTPVTEGKERGETWNVTQIYWLSSGSHPDLGSIPNDAQTSHQTAQMRKFLEMTNLRACLFKACGNLIDFFWTYSGEKSYSRVHWLRLWCCSRVFLSTVEKEWPSPKPTDVLGVCSSDLYSTSLQGWMKHSKCVLYIFLILFEVGSWKTLHAYQLLLALVSFNCSVCITLYCLLPHGWLRKL